MIYRERREVGQGRPQVLAVGAWRAKFLLLVGLGVFVAACGGSDATDDGAQAESSAIDSAAQESETEDSASAEQADEAGNGDDESNAAAGQDTTEENSAGEGTAGEDTAADQENADSSGAADAGADLDRTGCAVPPPPGFPDAEQFSLVSEEEIFRCFQTDSFTFEGLLRSEVPAPDQLSAIDFASVSAEIDGERRYAASGTADSVVFEVVRVGDLVSVEQDGQRIELDLSNEVDAFQLIAIESTNAQFTLAGIGLIVVELYGGGAQQVGEEQLGGRTAFRWEADGDAIAGAVNELGVLPGPLEIGQAAVLIWTDEFGQVLKISADIPADAVTVGGVPATQIAGATDLGLPFGFVYEFEYTSFGEPVNIELP